MGEGTPPFIHLGAVAFSAQCESIVQLLKFKTQYMNMKISINSANPVVSPIQSNKNHIYWILHSLLHCVLLLILGILFFAPHLYYLRTYMHYQRPTFNNHSLHIKIALHELAFC